MPRLDPIWRPLRQQAWDALEQRDVAGFLGSANGADGLWLVWENARLLMKLAIYEPALLHAYTMPHFNNHQWPLADLRWLFGHADRQKLLAAGDPLPGPGPYTLYRGVAGHGRSLRIRGLSWTASRERAAWFAKRFADTLPDPGVYQITVPQRVVLACIMDRQEDEFVVWLPTRIRPVRLD